MSSASASLGWVYPSKILLATFFTSLASCQQGTNIEFILQNINPLDLLPHLQREDLLPDNDIDYIYDPKNSEKDKIVRILRTAPMQSSNAFEKFVECFEVDSAHKGHTYLARRLKEAIEMKRLYPFSKLAIRVHRIAILAHLYLLRPVARILQKEGLLKSLTTPLLLNQYVWICIDVFQSAENIL